MHRIGTFFLLLAIGLLVYFLLADSAGAPALQFLLEHDSRYSCVCFPRTIQKALICQR